MTTVDTKPQQSIPDQFGIKKPPPMWPTPPNPVSFATPRVPGAQNVTALLEEAAVMLVDAASAALRQAQANFKRAQEDADAIRQLSCDIQKVIGGETCS